MFGVLNTLNISDLLDFYTMEPTGTADKLTKLAGISPCSIGNTSTQSGAPMFQQKLC